VGHLLNLDPVSLAHQHEMLTVTLLDRREQAHGTGRLVQAIHDTADVDPGGSIRKSLMARPKTRSTDQ